MDNKLIEIDGHQVKKIDSHITNKDYHSDKRQIFIIGSKGIPASYGGYETFVECLTKYQKNKSIRYHVARLAKNKERFEYNGAKVFNVKINTRGPQKAIIYDIKALKLAIAYCKERPSIKKPIFYILACRIGPFFNKYVKQIHSLGGVVYVNPDGHEWLRAKWSKPIRKYWKFSERLMVKHADLLICDSKNIENYIHDEYKQYHPKTTFIAYGSNITPSTLSDTDLDFNNWLKSKNLKVNNYYLVVGRFVPENNYEIMIKEFMQSDSKKDFAIISTTNDKFLDELETKLHFKKDPRVKFVGTVYNEQLLKKIRENAFGYFHGHEVGGTNPSLLEALGSTDLNLLLDVGFNREVAENSALYWTKAEGSLANLINQVDSLDDFKRKSFGELAKQRISSAYSWDYIVNEYEKLFSK